MSGGRLVVLDRAGRDVKRFPLAEGLATLGSDPACDIRIMLPSVSPHHATVVVHANQTVVRNVCSDETLVNGRGVSVAALRHGDVITIGGRHLRWEYSDATVTRPQAPEPALYVSRRKSRPARRGSGPAAAAGPRSRDAAVQLAIEMTHRASMPGSAGGKQVAVVQPQRRDTSDHIDKNPPRTPLQTNKRPRTSKSELDTSVNDAENEKAKRKSNARVSPKTTLSNLQNTTKATLWIESRKSSPRKLKIQTPTQEQVLSLRKSKIQTPTQDQVLSPRKSRTQTPTQEQVLSPRKSRTQTPTQEQVLSPRKSTTQTPTQEQVLSPRKSRTQTPTQEQVLSPRKSRTRTPTQEQVSSPRKSRIQSPTQEQVLSLRKSRTQTPTQEQVSIQRKSRTRTPTQEQVSSQRKSRKRTPTHEQVSSSRKSRTQTPTQEEVSSQRKSRTRTPTHEQVSSSRKSRTQTPTQEEVSSSRKSRTQTPTQEQVSSPRKSRIQSPTQEQVSSQRKSRTQTPTHEQVSSSRKSRIQTPTQEQVLSPRKSRTQTPTQEQVSSPRKSRIQSPTQEQVLSPRKSRTQTPTQEQVLSPRKSRTRTPTHEQVSSSRKSRTQTPTQEQVLSPRKPRTQTPTQEQVLSPRNSRTHTPTQEQVSSSRKSRTQTPTQEQVLSPRKSRTQTPTQEQVLSPRKSRTQTPTQEQVLSPRKSRTQTPTQEQVLSPRNSRTHTPTQEQVLSPRKSRTQTPIQERVLSPRKSKIQTPTQEQVLIPRKSKIQSPTQEQVLSPRLSNKSPSLELAPRGRRLTASARRSTPLRLAVLRRAQSARKVKVTKIEGPLRMDHTKQAAILLMTGHTPKAKLPSASAPHSSKKSPSVVVKKPSPLRRSTLRSRNSRATPNSSARTSTNDCTVTILEITDSDGRNSSRRTSTASRRSGHRSPKKSPTHISPKKSALKDPSAKRGSRKTESIKFDLSNLENYSQDTDVLMVTNTTKHSYEGDSASDDEITLRYSESSIQSASPSPRRSIHSSRTSKILEKSLGTTFNMSSPSRTITPESPRSKRSLRGSLILQKALNETETLSYSRRSTKSVSDSSQTTIASAYRTRTLSPRTPRNEMESYSIVDLVSIDTDESARSTSVYDSAGSADNTAFGTPQTSTGRKTRSTIDPTLLGSSTPYVKGRSSIPRSRSNPSPQTSRKSSINESQSTTRSSKSRRSKSLSTPENTEDAIKHISVNSTRISRASRSRSRINDSDLLLLDDDDDSPRTSKRISTTSKSTRSSAQTANNTDVTPSTHTPAQNEGTSTPENRHSPEEASTPVLSIQSLLDSSQSSLTSQRSTKRGRPSYNVKRKTIGVVTGPKTRVGAKSKSMNFSARKTRLRLSSDSVEALNMNQDDSELVTPKSAVKLVPEGVKNKHSTAKKPQSKRSMIDDLNESDIVKQLFNSPVKRKLSQSMTEFSRKQLFDDEDVVKVKRPTRHTIAMMDQTPDNSLLDHTESYTPEIFVSPISTPRHSPNLEGIKLLFAKSPENDLRNVSGVKDLLRTPRTRRSIKNDLTKVSGVKNVFAKSPKNRLSNVRVKEVFAPSPKNDLTRVSGVKSLFQSTKKRKSPRNELDDVRGVKKLFKTKSPANDLRNISGVKRTLRKHTPKNDLSDVRGVKRVFRRETRNDLNDVSGVEELFNSSIYSQKDAESLFDELAGRPQIKAVYSKTFSTKTSRKSKGKKTKSLHVSLDKISNNVEEWLQDELNKRSYKQNEASTSKSNKFRANMTRELQKLVTETVEGNAPTRTSRVRNSTIIQNNETDLDRKKSTSELYSAHTLPIKKRSFVEKSLDKSNNDSKFTKLPIKKRVVVHSTPVKGRINMTMNASVLGRVSPIAAIDETRFTEQDTSIRNIQPKDASEARPKSRRGTKANTDNIASTTVPESVKPSPKKTRGRGKVASPKAKPISPVKEKAVTPVRAQKPSPAKAKTASPVKKASPAKAKKASIINKASTVKAKAASPVNKASPAKGKKTKPVEKKSPVKKVIQDKTKKPSPAKKLTSPEPVKTTRSRRKDVSIPETNTKKRGATLVVTKKSPVMSPQPRASRKRKEPETSTTPKPSPKKTRTTRKNESVNDKPKTPKTTRAKVIKATVVVSKPSPQLKPRATKTKAQTDSEPENTRKTRKTVVKEKPELPKKSQVQKQSSKIQPEVQVAPKTTRGRKTVANVSKEIQVEKPEPKTRKGRKTDEPAAKNTRNNKDKSIEVPKTKTRGKKIEAQESVEPEPKTKTRRGAKTEIITQEVNTRKRKNTAPDNEIPPKVKKSKEVAEKGREITEVKETATTRKKSVVKESKVEKPQSEAPVKATRGRKAAQVETVKAVKEPEQKPGRGRKAIIENVPAKQATGKRKRATAAEPSPAEVPRGKKQRGTAGAAPAPQRQTRGNTQTEGKPAGRSRRR